MFQLTERPSVVAKKKSILSPRIALVLIALCAQLPVVIMELYPIPVSAAFNATRHLIQIATVTSSITILIRQSLAPLSSMTISVINIGMRPLGSAIGVVLVTKMRWWVIAKRIRRGVPRVHFPPATLIRCWGILNCGASNVIEVPPACGPTKHHPSHVLDKCLSMRQNPVTSTCTPVDCLQREVVLWMIRSFVRIRSVPLVRITSAMETRTCHNPAYAADLMDPSCVKSGRPRLKEKSASSIPLIPKGVATPLEMVGGKWWGGNKEHDWFVLSIPDSDVLHRGCYFDMEDDWRTNCETKYESRCTRCYGDNCNTNLQGSGIVITASKVLIGCLLVGVTLITKG